MNIPKCAASCGSQSSGSKRKRLFLYLLEPTIGKTFVDVKQDAIWSWHPWNIPILVGSFLFSICHSHRFLAFTWSIQRSYLWSESFHSFGSNLDEIQTWLLYSNEENGRYRAHKTSMADWRYQWPIMTQISPTIMSNASLGPICLWSSLGRPWTAQYLCWWMTFGLSSKVIHDCMNDSRAFDCIQTEHLNPTDCKSNEEQVAIGANHAANFVLLISYILQNGWLTEDSNDEKGTEECGICGMSHVIIANCGTEFWWHETTECVVRGTSTIPRKVDRTLQRPSPSATRGWSARTMILMKYGMGSIEAFPLLRHPFMKAKRDGQHSRSLNTSFPRFSSLVHGREWPSSEQVRSWIQTACQRYMSRVIEIDTGTGSLA